MFNFFLKIEKSVNILLQFEGGAHILKNNQELASISIAAFDGTT
ncbi:hypothetical protein [Arenibacter arenosicollis]|nr:hypothetical protein [Arenibacter arenosicollis]